jgi:hypothetical protein
VVLWLLGDFLLESLKRQNRCMPLLVLQPDSGYTPIDWGGQCAEIVLLPEDERFLRQVAMGSFDEYSFYFPHHSRHRAAAVQAPQAEEEEHGKRNTSHVPGEHAVQVTDHVSFVKKQIKPGDNDRAQQNENQIYGQDNQHMPQLIASVDQ